VWVTGRPFSTHARIVSSQPGDCGHMQQNVTMKAGG